MCWVFMIDSAHSLYGFAVDELYVVGCCVDFLVGCQSKVRLVLSLNTKDFTSVMQAKYSKILLCFWSTCCDFVMFSRIGRMNAQMW
jgi:hypothetical protein